MYWRPIRYLSTPIRTSQIVPHMLSKTTVSPRPEKPHMHMTGQALRTSCVKLCLRAVAQRAVSSLCAVAIRWMARVAAARAAARAAA